MLTREKRHFYRHPVNVPIQLRLANKKDLFVSESSDISLGGLSFLWPTKLAKGAMIRLTIPVKEKLFEIVAKVVYSKTQKQTSEFRTGVLFVDSPSAFRARLAEEVLQIIEYRKNLSRSLGYELSEEEAARQWVREYASKLPPAQS